MNAVNNLPGQELTLTTFTRSASSLQQRMSQIELAFRESALAEQRIVALIEANATLMEVDQEMTDRGSELDLAHQAEMDELNALHQSLNLEYKAAQERNTTLKRTMDELKTTIQNLQKHADALVSPMGLLVTIKVKQPWVSIINCKEYDDFNY